MTLSLVINAGAIIFIDEILRFIRIPAEVYTDTRAYLLIVFFGLTFQSFYNYFASVVRSLGNSTIPQIFLVIAAVINIVLDSGRIRHRHYCLFPQTGARDAASA